VHPIVGSDRQQLVDSVSRVIRLDAELPDPVFDRELTRFYACDVLFALGGNFAHVLNRLGSHFGDRSCALVARRPTASDFENRGTAGALRIDLPVDDAELWEAFNDEPGGDVTASMESALESWVIVGESRKWACWCDRSYELAVLAAERELSLENLDVPFQGVSDQVREMLRLGSGELPNEALEKFESFYG